MKQILKIAIFSLGFSTQAVAEEISLEEYLASMDRTEITFSGRIKYDDTSLSNPFTFYDDNREKFGVTIDAGRDVRERVETDCIERSAMFSYNDLCIISGRGTVEIRGSQVFISVHQIDSLSK